MVVTASVLITLRFADLGGILGSFFNRFWTLSLNSYLRESTELILDILIG
jgi:hypothetical protein